ncbi:MAG TPA: hypothetical protein ENI23_17025 [bacterium]|nr:hypothetical protein [bacterium]
MTPTQLTNKLQLELRRAQEEVRNLSYRPEFIKEFWVARDDLKHAKRRWNYFTDIDTLYPDRYFEKRSGRMKRWENKLGWAMSETLKIHSLVDFGCAVGSYLEGASNAGTEKILGYEFLHKFAIKYVPEKIKPFIHQADVGEPIKCGKYDCAMSIEVAEHLLEEKTDVFVENLIRASNRLIILTASRRSGTRHINPHFREFWIGKFVVRGCQYSPEFTQSLRTAWKEIKAPEYLMFNLMIFTV